MKWLKMLFKLFVLVSYCVLLYMVAYVFPHEKAVPTHNQELVLSLGSIGTFLIVVVAIVVWEHYRGSCTDGSYKKKK